MEDSRESRKHGMPLLLHRRKITADAAKHGDAHRTAKGARNLLLHFGQANILLRLIIIIRYHETMQEGQHRLLISVQAIKQIARRIILLLYTSSGSLASR